MDRHERFQVNTTTHESYLIDTARPIDGSQTIAVYVADTHHEDAVNAATLANEQWDCVRYTVTLPEPTPDLDPFLPKEQAK